jgi:hypothetical protein
MFFPILLSRLVPIYQRTIHPYLAHNNIIVRTIIVERWQNRIDSATAEKSGFEFLHAERLTANSSSADSLVRFSPGSGLPSFSGSLFASSLRAGRSLSVFRRRFWCSRAPHSRVHRPRSIASTLSTWTGALLPRAALRPRALSVRLALFR